MAFGDVNCGAATDKPALIAIRRNGNYTPGTQVFAKSTDASVGILSVTIATGDGLGAAMSGSATIAIPGNWDTAPNNTLTDNVSSLVTVDSSTPGPGSGTLTYRATGTNPSGSTINRDDPMTVTWNVLDNCAPPNQAPTADAGGPYAVDEGGSVGLSGSGSDPNGDPLTYAWDLDNNGSFETPGQNVSFSAAGRDGPSTQTVVLRVCDDENACATSSATVAINNAPPTIGSVTNSGPVDEGSPATIIVTAADPAGVLDPLSYAFDCDNNSVYEIGPQAGNTAQCAYPDGPSSHTVNVRVTDGDGGEDLDSTTVVVNNVPPTVAAGFTSTSVNCQTTATLTIDPGDAGVNDSPWKVNIDWGDGSSEPEISRTNLDSFTVTHVYALPATYNATVSVKDKDNATGSDLTNGVTINQTYTVDFLPPFDDSTPSGLIVNKMKNGRVVPVKATLFDDCTKALVTDPSTSVTIKVTKTSGGGGASDPVEEYADAGQSSAGTNMFRWSTDGFWIYNLDSKALGLVVDNAYRIDVYVGAVKATTASWAVLQPVK
jgi:hypothetical protein